MSLVLDGAVVRHTARPFEQLYERSPILFAGFVFLMILLWIVLASAVNLAPWLMAIGMPVVLGVAALTPTWLEVRNYAIEGNRRIIIDERGLQIEGTLIPWDELHFHKHDDCASSMSIWELGSETITASFEHESRKFSVFLGVRFKPLAPIAMSETIDRTLSDEETLKLGALITEHLEGNRARGPAMSDDPWNDAYKPVRETR